MDTVFTLIIFPALHLPLVPPFPLLLILFVLPDNFASISCQIYMHDFM